MTETTSGTPATAEPVPAGSAGHDIRPGDYVDAFPVEPGESAGFTFICGYNLAQAVRVGTAETTGLAGLITGAWEWDFGARGRLATHINAATAIRTAPYMVEGTAAFEMPGGETLMMRYSGLRAEPNGVSFFAGSFIGGTGPFAGATGEVSWSGREGFIRGEGTVRLAARAAGAP